MTPLTDEQIIDIAKSAATANNVNFVDVAIAPAIASTGFDAIEIKIVLTPGSSGTIMGERSARTVSQVIQKLADAGDARSPIVRYEEEIASP